MASYPQQYSAVPAEDTKEQKIEMQSIPVYHSNAQFVPARVVPVEEPQPVEQPESISIGMPSILIASEVLGADECGCYTSVIKGFNYLYRGGFMLSYLLLTVVLMIAAPVLGIAMGILTIVSQIVRAAVRPVGRIVADLLGYGTYLTTSIEHMKSKTHSV